MTQLEGAGGGGLVPWALITGYGTRDAVGANAHFTSAYLPISSCVSWRQRRADGSDGGVLRPPVFQHRRHRRGARARLGLPPSTWISSAPRSGSWRRRLRPGSLAAAGRGRRAVQGSGAAPCCARSARADRSGVDFYLAATKLLMGESLLVNATVRETRANQFGLLGFGGDRWQRLHAAVRGLGGAAADTAASPSAPTPHQADDLGFAQEDTAFDIFIACFLDKHLSATLVWPFSCGQRTDRPTRQPEQHVPFLAGRLLMTRVRSLQPCRAAGDADGLRQRL